MSLCQLTSLALISLLALTMPVTEATATAQLLYTPAEKRASEVLAASDKNGAKPLIAILDEIKKEPLFQTPLNQALIATQQCDWAVRAGLETSPYTHRLKLLRQQAGESDTPLQTLEQHCLITIQYYSAEPPTFEQMWEYYRRAETLELPWLRYRIYQNYSFFTHGLGLLDESLKAGKARLSIAQANKDARYEREALARIATIQADLGLHQDALRNSKKALVLFGKNPSVTMLINHGYVQMRAKDYEAARQSYEQALKKAETNEGTLQSSDILSSLAAIYFYQEKVQENLAITENLITLARQINSPTTLGHSEMARALALTQAGDIATAQKLHKQGFRHLDETGEYRALAEYLVDWSRALGKKQHWQEAYSAAEQARVITERYQTDQSKRHGQYLSEILQSAQKDHTISSLRHENRIAQLEAQRRKATSIAWAIGLGSLTIGLVVLLAFYWRLRKANARLHHENSHDNLTRLHNRAYFTKHFKTKAQQATHGRAILALLDIDHFKQINDTWGHAVGDEVLQHVAARLRAALRSSDVIARWGGEEIAVLVQDLHPNLRAADFAERLRNTLARSPLEVSDQSIPVTVSIGYIEFELSPANQLDILMEKVDERLYAAKRNGRNRAVGEDVVSV